MMHVPPLPRCCSDYHHPVIQSSISAELFFRTISTFEQSMSAQLLELAFSSSMPTMLCRSTRNLASGDDLAMHELPHSRIGARHSPSSWELVPMLQLHQSCAAVVTRAEAMSRLLTSFFAFPPDSYRDTELISSTDQHD